MIPPPVRFVPKPITDRVWWDTVASDDRWLSWREKILAIADAAPAVPERLQASTLLRVKRHNDRTANDAHISGGGRKTMAALIIRRCLHGMSEPAGDDVLLDTLWAHATEPSWTHMAHIPGNELPQSQTPIIDLMACEQAAALAEAIEVLQPWLNRESHTIVGTIINAIDRHVLIPFGAGLWCTWDRDVPNNWMGVCSGAILCACEALAAVGHPRPAARSRAFDGLRRYVLGAFTEHGECDEGIGYWSYGMLMANLGWSRIDPAQWPDRERLALVADYPRRCHLFGDYFYSGNDSGMVAHAGLSLVPWLARGLQDAWLWDWSCRASSMGERHLGLMLRECAALEWCPSASAVEPSEAPTFLPDQQAGVLRNGGLVAVLAGGTNAENHNHNDLGHVVIGLAGRFILPDFGAPKPYPGDFFGPKRYDYLVAGSYGHSVLRINGHQQWAVPHAAGLVLVWDGTRLDLDLTSAYPPVAGLSRWVRSLALHQDGVRLIDRVTLERSGTIEHALWSHGDYRDQGLAISVSPPGLTSQVAHDPLAAGVGHVFTLPLMRHAWTWEIPGQIEFEIETLIRPSQTVM